jgi:hypothetical protein
LIVAYTESDDLSVMCVLMVVPHVH